MRLSGDRASAELRAVAAMAITSYDIAPLRACDIEKSFPVAQMAHPALSLESWRAHAAAALDPTSQRGIFLATRNGYVYGLGSYCLTTARMGEPALEIDDIIAVDFVSAVWIHHRLLKAMEGAARRSRCTIMIDASDRAGEDAALAAALAQCGLVEDGPCYAKRLPIAVIHDFARVAATV